MAALRGDVRRLVVLIGAALPQVGPEASPASLSTFAQRAEANGVASLWVCERLLRPFAPVRFDSGTVGPALDTYATAYDPLVTLTWVAAQTTRVALGTSVLNAPWHRPALLAKSLATLDQVSGGRLVVGLGIGWMAEEFAAAGVDRARRGVLLDDVIEGLRALWGPDPVVWSGATGAVPPAQYGPKPLRLQGPPILLGGASPAALARSVRLGTGLHPVTMPARPRAYVRSVVDAVRAAWEPADRALTSKTFVLRIHNRLTDQPLPEKDRGWVCGTAEQAAEDLAELSAMDIDHVVLDMTMAFDGPPVPVEDQLRLLGDLTALVPPSPTPTPIPASAPAGVRS